MSDSSIIPVIDALRELFEPVDPVDEERSVNGILLDRTCSAPYKQAANTLYGWEEACRESPMGTGEVRQDFEIVFVYTIDTAGEESVSQRSRDVSEALDVKRAEWMRKVRLFANIPPWDSGNIQATSDADFLRQLELRGIAIRVAGYRLVTEV